MSKMTVFEMVKKIMSGMDSDETTSINDIPEAAQVASSLEDVYWQLITDQTIPEFMQLRQLETINLSDFPGAINYFKIPDDVSKVYWVQYNRKQASDTTDAYGFLQYLTPLEFTELVSHNRTDVSDTVQVTDPDNGLTYNISNDTAPNYWTTFDDEYIAVENIDLGIDTTQVLGTKTRCQMVRSPTWTNSDSFIPDIDENFFPLLLAETKATCFIDFKQQANPKAEGQSRGQRLRLQNHKFKTSDSQKADTGSTGPDYGRRTPRAGIYLGHFYNQ